MNFSIPKQKINVVIPMAGAGSRFSSFGFITNKYLLPIDLTHTKMIEGAITTLGIDGHMFDTTFIFILRKVGEESFTELCEHLTQICERYYYGIRILRVDEMTDGPASTVFVAKEYIDNDTPLIVSNTDQLLKWNFRNFFRHSMKYDGTVLTYRPDYKLEMGSTDKHSFVRVNESGVPVQFIEKTVISDEALVGVHFYKKGAYFVDAYSYMVAHNLRAPNREFYMSYTYQALIEMGEAPPSPPSPPSPNPFKYSLGLWKLGEHERFIPLGEPNDYFEYYNERVPFITTPPLGLSCSLKILKSLLGNIITNKTAVFEETVYFKEQIQPTVLTQDRHRWNKIHMDFIESSPLTNQPAVFKNEIVFLFDKDPLTNIIGYRAFYSGKRHSTTTIPANTMMLRVVNVFGGGEYRDLERNNYTRGWMIGNFEPSALKTPLFEVGIMSHKKGELHAFHFHKIGCEINVLLKGKMKVNGVELKETQIFILEPNQLSCPEFLEDCEILCLKIPSVPTDKHNR
jgi:dTDP-glucose pyrophosphorylase